MFPVVDDVVPSFPPLRDSSGLLAPNKHLARLLSLFFLYAPSPPISVYSADSPPVSDPPHRPSVGELPTLRLRPTNVLFWFPDPASHMQVCTPPRSVRLVVLGLGVVGGAKETAPPTVVLSPSSRRQASPASGQVHAYARRSISLLILAVPAVVLSPSPRRQASLVNGQVLACYNPTLDFPLDSCGARLSSFCPPHPPPPFPVQPNVSLYSPS